MVSKKIAITVTKETDLQCNQAVQAAVDLIKHLPHNDLIYIADLAKRKPNFVTKAKPYEKFL